jgi:hypothetical protein
VQTDHVVQLEAPPTAIVATATAVPTCAPAGGFGLQKLQLEGSPNTEDYVYTAGNVICPQFGVDTPASAPFKYYTLVVTDTAGTPATVVACTITSNAASLNNTYTVQPSPLSNATPYTFTLTQYTNSTCTTIDGNKTQSKTFDVAGATIYADAGLTQQQSTFGAGATAYVVVSGTYPAQTNWSVTWYQPGSSTSTCANTSGGNMPASSSGGRLPSANATSLQYPPSSSASDNWNKTSSYSPSCPAFGSSNVGTWTLELQRDNQHFVTLPVFTITGTVQASPSTDLAGNGQILAPGTGFFYTFHSEKSAVISAAWNPAPTPTTPVMVCLYTDQPAQTPPSYIQDFAFSDTKLPPMQITDEITGGSSAVPLEGTTAYAPTDSGYELDDHYLDGSSTASCSSGTGGLTYTSSGNEEPGYYTAYFYNGSSGPVSTDTRHAPGATVTYQAATQDDSFAPHEQYFDSKLETHNLPHASNTNPGTNVNAWCIQITTAASAPITVTWNLQTNSASAVQLYLYSSSPPFSTSSCEDPTIAGSGSVFHITLPFSPGSPVASNTNTIAVTLLTLSAPSQPAGTYYVLFYNPDTTGGNDATTQSAANDGAVITYEH